MHGSKCYAPGVVSRVCQPSRELRFSRIVLSRSVMSDSLRPHGLQLVVLSVKNLPANAGDIRDGKQCLFYGEAEESFSGRHTEKEHFRQSKQDMRKRGRSNSRMHSVKSKESALLNCGSE